MFEEKGKEEREKELVLPPSIVSIESMLLDEVEEILWHFKKPISHLTFYFITQFIRYLLFVVSFYASIRKKVHDTRKRKRKTKTKTREVLLQNKFKMNN